jgi:hypothetical protein
MRRPQNLRLKQAVEVTKHHRTLRAQVHATRHFMNGCNPDTHALTISHPKYDVRLQR